MCKTLRGEVLKTGITHHPKMGFKPYTKHLYSNTDSVPPSILPTPKTSRKLPSVRKPLIPDERELFGKSDEIKTFSELTDKLCPFEYKLDLDEEKGTFYKTEYHAM